MLFDIIQRSILEAIEIQNYLKNPESIDFIMQLSATIVEVYETQKKFIIAGNGGSLCDADHFSEELSGFFRSRSRPAIGAISLSQPAHITCVANDIGFEQVFSRGIESLGQMGDVFVAISTSGNSKNLYNALVLARKKGLKTIAFLGGDGGVMRGMSDLEWIVPGFGFSDRIQEVHMSAIHIAIEAAESKILSLAHA